MTVPAKLSGGQVIEFDPTAFKFPINADAPNFKFWANGNWWASAGAMALARRLSVQAGGEPEPTHVLTFVRRTPAGTFIGLVPAKAEDPKARELKFNGSAATVRDVRSLFEAAGLQLRDDVVYVVPCILTEDETFGPCVAGNWSTAETRPRRSRGAGREDEPPEAESGPAAPGA